MSSVGVAQIGRGFSPATGGGSTPPDPPTMSISLSGTTVTATITATVGITVNLYKKATTDSVWVLAGTRTGSGTIVVSGLSAAMQYVFVAVATDGVLYSLPTIALIVETASGFIAELAEFQSDGLAFMLASSGEEIDFYPAAGGTRSILAIVDRLGAQDIPGAPEGSTEVFRIVVLNDPAAGISTTEINVRKSKVGIARRPGLDKQVRVIWSIENQDEGAMQILAG